MLTASLCPCLDHPSRGFAALDEAFSLLMVAFFVLDMGHTLFGDGNTYLAAGNANEYSGD